MEAPRWTAVITQPVEGGTHSRYSSILVEWIFGGSLEEAEGFCVALAKPGEDFKAISSPHWLQGFQYTIPGSYFDTLGGYRVMVVPGIGWSDTVTIEIVAPPEKPPEAPRFNIADWLPMLPWEGPPLPRLWGFLWPWVK